MLLLALKFPPGLGKDLRLRLQVQESLLIVSRDDLTSRRPHQLLKTLRALEPSWMVSRKPTLGDAISPLHSVSKVELRGGLE